MIIKIFGTVSIIVILTIKIIAQPLTPMAVSIPMRDGKFLSGDVYLTPMCSQCPTILIQTPYVKYWYRYGLPLGIDTAISTLNYNIVTVDWRGFGGSISAIVANPDYGKDGYDVIDWIVAQSWSDGKVGTWGPSALGVVQYRTAKEHHPNHICMVPLVASPQFYYNEYYPGGSLRTEYVQQLDALDFGISPFVVPYPTHNWYWNLIEPPSYYPDSINIPTLMIGGWYDFNVIKMIDFWNGMKSSSPVWGTHRLLMGPWAHGGHGVAEVGTSIQGELTYPNAAGWSDSLAMRFFDFHLRSVINGWDTTSLVTYYQMGEDQWHYDTDWPPAGVTLVKFYLHGDYSGCYLQPGTSNCCYDSIVQIIYDPTNPSPTWGGQTLRLDLMQGPYDQDSVVESRNDVVMFNFDCSQDVVCKGVPTAHIFMSSNVYDTDIAIRLTDVYPDGRSMILSDGIQRMRFRNGTVPADTSAIVPGQIYQAVIALPDIAHTFVAGHKIRLDISGSNYPRFNRNMNTDGEMYPNNNMDTLVNPQTAITKLYLQQLSLNDSYLSLPLYGSSIVGTDENLINDFKMNVFPNPVVDVVIVDFILLDSKIVTIALTDVMGRIVKSFYNGKLDKGQNSYNFNVTGIPSGFYLLSITDENKTNQTVKLIVNR